MSRNMSPETARILQHIAVHGTRTRPEVAKAFPGNERVDPTISNLMYLGYLACDDNTKPAQYSLTGKGRQKLIDGGARAPKRDPAKLKADIFSPGLVDTRARYVPRGYQASEYAPSTRPGAMAAFSFPSRFGDTLRYRDGRRTDMDGNTIND